jgi:hypothetical protein
MSPESAPAPTVAGAPQTHEAALARIEEIRAAAIENPTHPLVNARHPNHDATMAEYLALHGFVAGEKTSAADGEPVDATDPRPSDDPEEAAIGLTAPEPRNPQAIEQHFALQGVTLEGEDLTFARGVSAATPPPLVGDVVDLIRDADSMVEPARTERWSEELAWTELERRHGSKAEEIVERATVAWEQLGPRERQYLEARGLNTYPAFVERMAKIGEKFLNHDDGIRYRIRTAPRELEARRQMMSDD